MSEALLPCPFCGSEPWGIFGPLREEGGTCWVECHGTHENDSICGDWHFEGTREETKAAWNTRATSARIAELEALLAESQDALSVALKGLMELSLEVRGLGNPAAPSLELHAAEAGWPTHLQSTASVNVNQWPLPIPSQPGQQGRAPAVAAERSNGEAAS